MFDRIAIDSSLQLLDRFAMRTPVYQGDAEPVIGHRTGLRISGTGDLLELAGNGEGVIERGCPAENSQR